MGITPWFVGQVSPVWTINILPDSGTFNASGLVPSNFSMVFRNTDASGIVDINGTGTFSNVTVASGSAPATVQYTPSSTDVQNAANYRALVKVVTGTGLAVIDLGMWQVLPL